MTTSDIHALAGAYVLDAIDDVERAAFARHLAGCEACALEVAELRETVTRLADESWSAPPPRMRDEVLAKVRQTRQLGPGRPEREGTTPALLRWRRRTAIAVAAGILVAGAGTATWAVQQQEVQRQRAVNESVQAVLIAPDAVVRSSAVEGGGRMTMVVSRSLDRGVVVLDATKPTDEQAYQLWRVDGTSTVDAGVLDPGTGTATRVVDGINSADAVALTLEPAGGSAKPTVLPPLAGVPTI
jgi:anti-sigma factor RsiW